MPEIMVLEFTAPKAAEIYRSVNHLLGLEEGSSDLGRGQRPCSATSPEPRVTS